MKFSATVLTVLGALAVALVGTEATTDVCIPLKSEPLTCHELGCCNPRNRCQANGKCCAKRRQECNETLDCCGSLVCKAGHCTVPPTHPPSGGSSDSDE